MITFLCYFLSLKSCCVQLSNQFLEYFVSKSNFVILLQKAKILGQRRNSLEQFQGGKEEKNKKKMKFSNKDGKYLFFQYLSLPFELFRYFIEEKNKKKMKFSNKDGKYLFLLFWSF